MVEVMKNDEHRHPSSMDSRGEAQDPRRGPANRPKDKRSVPTLRDSDRTILCLGKTSKTRESGSSPKRETRTKEEKPRSKVSGRDRTAEGCDNGAQCGEPGLKKGALALKPYRRYEAREKELILKTVEQTHEMTGQSVEEVLGKLGISVASYYRWKSRAAKGCLDDVIKLPYRKAVPPTPEEVLKVCGYALEHPEMGYKRLTWQMVDEDIAYLRPYQVYRILEENNLILRRDRPNEGVLKRPPEPDHPDQVWYIDLMYLYIHPRWYYLVDILDGYSRYLVNWSLNLTMTAETVTLTVQEALEKLPKRHVTEPRLIHDHGTQFSSAEWRSFVRGAGLQDIRTRVAHPESNGRLERLHRTHREEGFSGEELEDYYQALDTLEGWSYYYNYRRPHSALNYLCPIDYYRGDPAMRLAERERKLREAFEARKAYWGSSEKRV